MISLDSSISILLQESKKKFPLVKEVKFTLIQRIEKSYSLYKEDQSNDNSKLLFDSIFSFKDVKNIKLSAAILDVLRILTMTNSDSYQVILINLIEFLRSFKDINDENFQIKLIQTLLCFMSPNAIKEQRDYRVFEMVNITFYSDFQFLFWNPFD